MKRRRDSFLSALQTADRFNDFGVIHRLFKLKVRLNAQSTVWSEDGMDPLDRDDENIRKIRQLVAIV